MNEMAGTMKVKFKHTQPVILHADMMDDFKKAIDQDVSSFFREIQEDVVDKYRKEKEKKGEAHLPRGALINYIYNKSNKDSERSQTTLDVFAKITDINVFINELKDPRLLQQMKKNAHVIESVARTKLIKISKSGVISR